MLKETTPKIPRAFAAIEGSPRLEAILDLCLLGHYDDADRNFARGDSAYHAGDAGILAGALAAYHGEHRHHGWRAWLPAARVVLEMTRQERGKTSPAYSPRPALDLT